MKKTILFLLKKFSKNFDIFADFAWVEKSDKCQCTNPKSEVGRLPLRRFLTTQDQVNPSKAAKFTGNFFALEKTGQKWSKFYF